MCCICFVDMGGASLSDHHLDLAQTLFCPRVSWDVPLPNPFRVLLEYVSKSSQTQVNFSSNWQMCSPTLPKKETPLLDIYHGCRSQSNVQ